MIEPLRIRVARALARQHGQDWDHLSSKVITDGYLRDADAAIAVITGPCPSCDGVGLVNVEGCSVPLVEMGCPACVGARL